MATFEGSELEKCGLLLRLWLIRFWTLAHLAYICGVSVYLSAHIAGLKQLGQPWLALWRRDGIRLWLIWLIYAVIWRAPLLALQRAQSPVRGAAQTLAHRLITLAHTLLDFGSFGLYMRRI